MILSYYKYTIKSFFVQAFLKYKLRKRNYIGKKCFISKDVILEGNNFIHDYVYLLENVKLKRNARIGIRALISNIEVGENSFLESGVMCTGFGEGRITIGKESYIGINNILDWSNNISIGDYVHIAGPSTGLWTHSSVNMTLKSTELNNSSSCNRYTLPIKIEDNVFIGGGCIIYPGVTIHHHSIVAPNSTVVKDVESYTMVGGSPAKIIKNIDLQEK
jgi:acetyltransferase-like isoleucine patch superfamily enzyme